MAINRMDYAVWMNMVDYDVQYTMLGFVFLWYNERRKDDTCVQ